jgi:uncharacterized protein YyaL (SSP411 family)
MAAKDKPGSPSTTNPISGKPAAYVCQNYTCQAPVTHAAALKKLLR